MVTDRIKEMVKEIVYSDFADEIIIYRLESCVENCFAYLDQINNLTDAEHLFDDYYENILMIRGCIQVLKWFTLNDYQETTIKVNKYSRKLEEMF